MLTLWRLLMEWERWRVDGHNHFCNHKFICLTPLTTMSYTTILPLWRNLNDISSYNIYHLLQWHYSPFPKHNVYLLNCLFIYYHHYIQIILKTHFSLELKHLIFTFLNHKLCEFNRFIYLLKIISVQNKFVGSGWKSM